VKRFEDRPGLPSAARAVCATALAIMAFPAATAANASTSHRCSAASLRLTSVRLHPTATVTYWDFAIRTVGSGGCRMRGYPSVRLLGRRGKPLPDRFTRVQTQVRTVTVRTRRAAFFTVLYAPGRRCPRDHHDAYGLTAVPPDTAGALTVSRRRFAVCDTTVGGKPNISPVRSRLNSL
jgi:hypothetical protein